MTPLVVAGLVLLLLPSVQADPIGALESSSVSVGRGDLDGDLALTFWDAPAPKEDLAFGVSLGMEHLVEVPGLSIAAAHADITLYSVNWTAGTEGRDTQVQSWQLENVTVAGAVGDAEDARLIALPSAPGAAAVAARGWPLKVVPAPAEVRVIKNFVTDAPDITADLRPALQVTPVDGSLLQVTGSFRLVVNGLDLTLASDDGELRLDTRFDYQEVAGVGGKVGVYQYTYSPQRTSHEAVLDLVDATVFLPAEDIAVLSAGLRAEGMWTFEGATGSVQLPDGSQTIATEPEPVQLDASLDARLLRHGDLVGSTLDGSVSGLLVDGRPVAAPSSTAAVSASEGLPAWALLASAGVLALVSHWAVGRRRFHRLDGALGEGRYDDALRLAQGFRLHPWFRQDATLAAALSLGELGRPADARQQLMAHTNWAPQRRATRDFLLARAAARLGDRAEAIRLLAASLLADPALRAQAAMDPALADILPRGDRGPGEAYA